MTRLLLDTNVWLWMAQDDDRLGASTRSLLNEPETDLILSAVSVWELTIKWSLGKLGLPVDPATFVAATVAASGLSRLSISFDHVLRVATLPSIHKDPFDRLLVAQSIETGAPLLTGDPMLSRYGVPVVDATS